MRKLFLFLLFLSCTKSENIDSLSPAEFESRLKSASNAILIDVRTESEVKEGALPNAKNIVYDDSFADKLEGLPKDAPIFVYCAKGKRSEKAARIMREKGFKDVYQLSGGLDAWKQAKIPL